MPDQSDLDAALGGVILGQGPEEGSIAIWPLKGTVRVMEATGRRTTLVAPKALEEGSLPDPALFSAEGVLVTIDG